MKEIQLNPQQVEAVSHKDGPMIVLSVAGSGKTMVLIERIIHLIPVQ
ncbi:MAG: UvrD-helicase domain-containing protein [Pseudomonadota bacterium]